MGITIRTYIDLFISVKSVQKQNQTAASWNFFAEFAIITKYCIFIL